MKTLVTGAAGFIGSRVAARLLAHGTPVVGVDNLNSYYDPRLKRDRLANLCGHPLFTFREADIADRAAMEAVFSGPGFGTVIHLAAQAGVRHSIDNPHVYAASNLVGFLHILEGARRTGVRHLIYASSSSVYGTSSQMPFAISDRADTPVSLYAATKRSNELMAHCYSHLYDLPATGLRFFTVYGPWGRPDMAPFRFARAILAGDPIDVYNYGRMQRDFTYIDDIAEGVVRVAEREPAGYRLFNVGASHPVGLLDFIGTLERALGRRARKRFLPLQPGDVVSTHADVEDFWRFAGFRPATTIEDGVGRFAEWYREYYGEEQHEHHGQRHNEPGTAERGDTSGVAARAAFRAS
ncbi:MAG TPA: NAD-dependent epimerase/dehydratase family protein [Bryobacteraceae bacterium]|nr:NAD-dependent epimerase/dehydratase family protein [Bryobacteraceae bacterium]